MKSFKDAKGRTWDISVNVGTAKAVKDATTIDLFNLYHKETERVFSDPVLLVNVLYVVCKKQADERKISDEEFGEGLVGDPIEEAATALLQAISDFFPKGRRLVMEKMFAKSQTAAAQMEAEALKRVDELDVASLMSSMKSQG